MIFNAYLKEIATAFNTDKATEHSYRSALQSLLEGLVANVKAVNEPRRIECGAPDFVVMRNDLPFGYVECKDVNKSLDEAEKSEQLKRYRSSLPNLILTDYLEFRWYRSGEHLMTAKLGRIDGYKIRRSQNEFLAVGQLLHAFINSDVPVVGTTRELAERMAKTAQLIREAIKSALGMEDRGGSLHHQMEAFRTTLLHDITADKFADMYAQTICYGLFMARVYHLSGHFTREKAPYLLPKSNPFLREMFDHIAGKNLDTRIAWAVDNLAELFHHADINAILTDFGKRSSGKDPILHFYEDFLAAYDPKLRKSRGVYYTPEPVVSYIVRSVDKLLKRDFNLPLGLADAAKVSIPPRNGKPKEVHKVQILDPAVGTGSFLYGVVDHIKQTFTGNEGLWQGYVDNDLLPRLFGFELLMAPYTIAHLKVGMLLKESNYEFSGNQRLKIYLTNSLEESNKQIGLTTRFGFDEWLYKETMEAGDIKTDAPVMVVLGNPPYSGHSENTGKWIKDMIQPYFNVDGQPLGERNSKWLNDDYVKFIRFGQRRIEQTGYGILALITNHSYFDNPTFRGMRQSLMTTFDDIYLVDLHGNSKKKERCPDGSKDDNVFDIQQGVGIGLFVKKPTSVVEKSPATIHHTDLWGVREGKYNWLAENDVESTEWKILNPVSPFYLFAPQNMSSWAEYEESWKINDIFPSNSVGIVTARDGLTIKATANEVWQTVKDFIDCSPEAARDKFNLSKDSDWMVELAQKDLKQSGVARNKIVPILYRPFDVRYTYYTGTPNGFHTRSRSHVMRHMLAGENLSLIFHKREELDVPYSHFLVTDIITEHGLLSSKTTSYQAPLYLYPEGESRRPNLSPKFMGELAVKIGFEPTPEQAFHYIYGLFHSPTYRSRFSEFLKMDFPRVLMPPNVKLFNELCRLGEELVAYHLMEQVGADLVKYPVAGDDLVEQVRYADSKVWINKKQFFEPVKADVWDFHIGGYQVCHKWLKDRKGRKLSYDDIHHYCQVVAALSETIRLMDEIDQVAVRSFKW